MIKFPNIQILSSLDVGKKLEDDQEYMTFLLYYQVTMSTYVFTQQFTVQFWQKHYISEASDNNTDKSLNKALFNKNNTPADNITVYIRT